MSWQAYVDTSLVGSGNIDKAAIFNTEGTSVWATSAGFQIKPEEAKRIAGFYKDPGDHNVHAHGEKYMVVRSDDRSIYGKKGKEGLVVVRTKQAMLIGHYPDGVTQSAANTTVEALADYLIGQGY